MEEKTFQEYLEDISEEYQNELYLKIENKLNKKSKKENIYIDIIEKQNNNFFELEEENVKILKQILKGKEDVKINDKLKDIFVLCDKYKDNKNYIPLEFREVIESNIYEKNKEIIIKSTINLYIQANGLIELSKLLALLKKNKINIDEKELLKKIKQEEYVVKNNIVYLVQDISKSNIKELLTQKNEFEYKIFDSEEVIDEISKIINIRKKLCEKLEKNPKIPYEIIIYIYIYASITTEIDNLIIPLLEENNVKMNNKERKEFLSSIKNITKDLPKWLYNGYTNNKELIQANTHQYFNLQSENDRKKIYYYYYALINGMLEINKLKELLEKNNLKATSKEIEEYFASDEEFTITGNYIYHNNLLNYEELKQCLCKEKDKTEYKVITNVLNISDSIEKSQDKIKKICNKYKINEEDSDEIYLYMLYGFFNKKLFEEIIEDYKKISQKTLTLLYEELYKVSRDVISWRLNGYTKNEIINLPKANKKIGRNDLCPCGSGKKYKRCCGMK